MAKTQAINKILKGKHSFFRAPAEYARYRKKTLEAMDKEFRTKYGKLSARHWKSVTPLLTALKKKNKRELEARYKRRARKK